MTERLGMLGTFAAALRGWRPGEIEEWAERRVTELSKAGLSRREIKRILLEEYEAGPKRNETGKSNPATQGEQP